MAANIGFFGAWLLAPGFLAYHIRVIYLFVAGNTLIRGLYERKQTWNESASVRQGTAGGGSGHDDGTGREW